MTAMSTGVFLVPDTVIVKPPVNATAHGKRNVPVPLICPPKLHMTFLVVTMMSMDVFLVPDIAIVKQVVNATALGKRSVPVPLRCPPKRHPHISIKELLLAAPLTPTAASDQQAKYSAKKPRLALIHRRNLVVPLHLTFPPKLHQYGWIKIILSAATQMPMAASPRPAKYSA
jgi:hypothetical protein